MDRMKRIVKREEGFSLIEVIVAVAILAILSMPILLYFTNSAIQSANGRYEQAADMAAQTIVEEIDSVNNFDYIEYGLINAPDAPEKKWKVISYATDDDPKSELTKPVSVNGNKYIADVTIDYGGAYGSPFSVPISDSDETLETDDSDTSGIKLKAKYNNYQNPHFRDLYSDQSVVISEKKDTFETGVNNLFYELNGNAPGEAPNPDSTVSVSDIKAKIKKTYKLTTIAYPADMYTVKGSCVFGYDSNGDGGVDATEPTTEVVLINTQIEKTKLKSIYFLFMPTYGDKELSGENVTQNVIVDFNSMMEPDGVNHAGDMEVSFIRQNTYSIGADGNEVVDTPKVFTLKMDTSSGPDGLPKSKNHNMSKYFTNDKVELENGVVSGGLINKTKDKRIASVKVEIYRSDESGNKEGKVLATNTTSKSV